MKARLQPLLLDGILTANTLPRYFEFAGMPNAWVAAGMIDLHLTEVSDAARCEMWGWCDAAYLAAMRRYLEGWQALPRRA